MHGHGRAVNKFFLVFKRIIEGNMANQQGALPDPAAACDPATEDIVDIEFELLDVESEIVNVAAALAKSSRMPSLRDFLLPPDRLAVLSPANRLKLLRKHLSRLQNQLTSNSASVPRQNEPDRRLEGSTATATGQLTAKPRPAHVKATQPASRMQRGHPWQRPVPRGPRPPPSPTRRRPRVRRRRTGWWRRRLATVHHRCSTLARSQR